MANNKRIDDSIADLEDKRKDLNSIVVDVMCAMFKNLNIKQGDGNETLQTN